MKHLFFVLALTINSGYVHGQDTPFVYKVHYITSDDLKYEMPTKIEGVFTLGKRPSQKQLHFKDGSKFEKHAYFGIDSLAISSGTYGYNPQGWLLLKSVNGDLEKYAIIGFYKFKFLIRDEEQKKFETEFELVAGKYKYTALKNFQPHAELFRVCLEFSNRYFVKTIDE